MVTRRRFLITLPAVAAGATAEAQSFSSRFHRTAPAPPAPTFVYFGTDTDKGASHGIYLAHFNQATGQL